MLIENAKLDIAKYKLFYSEMYFLFFYLLIRYLNE